MKKLGLVLSGGSAYGFAHIGVLEVLEKNHINFDVVTGTSMGAIVGGLYACGIGAEKMKEILTSFTQNKIVDVNIFGLIDGGLVYGKKILRYFKKFVDDKKIEDCEKKFACVATDLVAGEEVVLNSGSIAEAMRASMSVPGLFKPVRKGKKVLVDGGLCNNLPVKLARELGADKVVSVDVTSYYKKENQLKTPLDVLISGMNLSVARTMSDIKDKGDVYLHIEQPRTAFTKLTRENAMISINYGKKVAKAMLPEIKNLMKD
jgi:NTE family protein